MGVADIVEGRYPEIMDFTCASSDAYSKGEILQAQDPRTAGQSASPTTLSGAAGFAVADKKANDGAVNIGVYRRGVVADVTCSGAIGMNKAVVNASDYVAGSAYQTAVKEADSLIHSAGQILGHTLEAGTDLEKVEIDVNVGAGGGT